MSVIVDHHPPGQELPQANAVFTCLPDSPIRDELRVGIAYQLARPLRRRGRFGDEPRITPAGRLAGAGGGPGGPAPSPTAPGGENRRLVRLGRQDAEIQPGIAELARVAGTS